MLGLKLSCMLQQNPKPIPRPLFLFNSLVPRITTKHHHFPLIPPKTHLVNLPNTTQLKFLRFALNNNNDNNNNNNLTQQQQQQQQKPNGQDRQPEPENGFSSYGADNEIKGEEDQRPLFNIKWVDLLLDSDADNILAVGLTGLLTWASVQVLWQIFVVSLAILVAALKYSFIAALLIIILITLL